MTTIMWPSDQTREVTDAIRGAIGRLVTVVIPTTTSACTVCSLDPVTNLSTDSFCPVCSGYYWITTFSGYTMSGHITWNPMDSLDWRTGGQVFNGDVRVQVAYTPENLAAIASAQYYIVDGIKCDFGEQTYRGFPINRIILNLNEDKSSEQVQLPPIRIVPAPTAVVAIDYGSNSLDGSYHNVLYGGDTYRALFNGTDSYVDVYSAELSLNSLNSFDELTVIIRGEVANAAVWTDGVQRSTFTVHLYDYMSGGTGLLTMGKASANNKLQYTVNLDSGAAVFLQPAYNSLGWFTQGITNSRSANEIKCYLDGVQTGATPTTTAWQSTIIKDYCTIGRYTPGNQYWKGWLADCVIGWGVAATAVQMQAIHNALAAGTLTTTYLDTVFGSGNYTWWKLNET